MLRMIEIATIRAALQYWREEICPHGERTAQFYLEQQGVTPLTSQEVEQLRSRFAPAELRYVILSADGSTVLDPRVYSTQQEAAQNNAGGGLAAVILPVA